MKAITAILLWAFAAVVYAAEPVWIDVRTAQEFSGGHVEGALNIPHGEVGDKVPAIVADKSTPIYLYCRSGNRAGKAKAALESLGYSHVSNLGSLAEAETKYANTQPM
ncbi:rhodanese-like domain-containing protein [uncultured Thalassolituus sp.]|jgi:phage shock protein E|uniref:rhodanese-like domain-containing protein n=1 Tax=Thalassolituus sp. TaxID=2030822 RepID=UPI00260FA942|nr:rhodanese-like domain-containing protein [uncultured Thalassolituus sp.]